jgi:CHASE1-domain containing sensor protein
LLQHSLLLLHAALADLMLSRNPWHVSPIPPPVAAQHAPSWRQLLLLLL